MANKALPPLHQREWLTMSDVGRVCRISPHTARKTFDMGVLKGYVVPGTRIRRVSRLALLKFMRANDIPTDLIDPRPEGTA